ncbi:MAG: ATP-dependent DNA helicase RecG [Anaeroplasma sp.]
MELSEIKGIGKITLEALSSNNINSINDLLFCFPKTYLSYDVNPDLLFTENYTCIECEVISRPVCIKYKKTINTILFYVNAYGYKLKCVCFSLDYLKYKLNVGLKIQIYGKYRAVYKEFLVRKIFFDTLSTKVEVDYKIKKVHNRIISRAVKAAFDAKICISETLPIELVNKYRLYQINEYIYKSHFPFDNKDIRQVLRRRKYEEFFWYAIRLELIKYSRSNHNKQEKKYNELLINQFNNTLEFEFTSDQIKTIEIIKKEMSSNIPMNRLVQGDVGCGKSIVAIYATLLAVSSGFQVAIMVPTELLAVQQYELCRQMLGRLGIIVELLTSSVTKNKKNDILYRLVNNRVSVIVGTHSIIEENVIFNKLGLVIIDEQHKFGVNQRQKLLNKFKNVDALYLTATPIPRTLGLTSFGDLDISSIKTMPKGRKKVITKIFDYNNLIGLFKFVNERIRSSEQVYVVVPLVDSNDSIDAISIYEAVELLKSNLETSRIGIVYGKMNNDDKNKIMQDFKNGFIDVLVSTTVIEVGVNVPKATMMIIFDADRFGLAQIHQLRGRVGRAELQSYCALVTSDKDNPRLNIVQKTNDGFEIAEEDLKLRGPGDYLGNNQSGYCQLDYADFTNDINIWNCAKADAVEFLPSFLNKKIKLKVFDEIIKENKNQKVNFN